jgi:hypothetical protein
MFRLASAVSRHLFDGPTTEPATTITAQTHQSQLQAHFDNLRVKDTGCPDVMLALHLRKQARCETANKIGIPGTQSSRRRGCFEEASH